MLLADFGADVVKVERAAGDPARALPGFVVWNRNKRGIVADLSSADGSARVHEFLAGADICVLGRLDPEWNPRALSAKYPGLVVLHMPPYTPSSTPWAGGAESNGLLCAA